MCWTDGGRPLGHPAKDKVTQMLANSGTAARPPVTHAAFSVAWSVLCSTSLPHNGFLSLNEQLTPLKGNPYLNEQHRMPQRTENFHFWVSLRKCCCFTKQLNMRIKKQLVIQVFYYIDNI